MTKWFQFLGVVLISASAQAALDVNVGSHLKTLPEAELKSELRRLVTVPHQPINYKQANLFLFTIVDNHQGTVCSVYSPEFCIVTSVVPSPKIMNIEHTWPQSEGANGIAKSDLHHIFPTSSTTNSIRSSLPFCDVVTVKWEADQSKRGLNSFGEHCFEPPLGHKGNVARALFYYSIRYGVAIDSHELGYFKQWHHEDPVDAAEVSRNELIKQYQGNTNPFVDEPELVELISVF